MRIVKDPCLIEIVPTTSSIVRAVGKQTEFNKTTETQN